MFVIEISSVLGMADFYMQMCYNNTAPQVSEALFQGMDDLDSIDRIDRIVEKAVDEIKRQEDIKVQNTIAAASNYKLVEVGFKKDERLARVIIENQVKKQIMYGIFDLYLSEIGTTYFEQCRRLGRLMTPQDVIEYLFQEGVEHFTGDVNDYFNGDSLIVFWEEQSSGLFNYNLVVENKSGLYMPPDEKRHIEYNFAIVVEGIGIGKEKKDSLTQALFDNGAEDPRYLETNNIALMEFFTLLYRTKVTVDSIGIENIPLKSPRR